MYEAFQDSLVRFGMLVFSMYSIMLSVYYREELKRIVRIIKLWNYKMHKPEQCPDWAKKKEWWETRED